jgi:uncharacterized protein involved in exopolysaccharide biosynthesis
MNEEPSYLHSMFRNFWIILLLAANGGAFAAWIALSAEPVFRSQVTLILSPDTDVETEDVSGVARSLESGSIQRTFALVLASSTIEDTVDEDLADVDVGAYSITAFALAQSSAVRVEVEGVDGDETRQIARGVAELGAAEFEAIYDGFDTEVITSVSERPSEVTPSPVLYAALGAAAGGFIGFLIGLVRDAWPSRPRANRRRMRRVAEDDHLPTVSAGGVARR